MSNSVYTINKGINQSIEFKGLKAQYIGCLGVAVVVLMILFAMLFYIGVPSFLCVVLIGILGTLMVIKIYKMSRQYGEFGLLKAVARKQLPSVIKANSRGFFR